MRCFGYQKHASVRPYMRPSITLQHTPLLWNEIESLFDRQCEVHFVFCSLEISHAYPVPYEDELLHRFSIYVDVNAREFANWESTVGGKIIKPISTDKILRHTMSDVLRVDHNTGRCDKLIMDVWRIELRCIHLYSSYARIRLDAVRDKF